MPPETSQEATSQEQVTQTEGQTQDTPAQQEQILDLDSVQKFKYAGREWTPKDFQGAYMMQSDYTRKTQALAEERKYYDNLQADIEAVKLNPSLADKFKSVYPEKFHGYLGYVTPQQAQVQKEEVSQAQGIDPAFMKRFTDLEKDLNDRKVGAIEAELDAKFSVLSKKYPMADEEAVISRAQAMLEKGEKLTDETWDGLWKSVHDKFKKLADTHYSTQVNNQKSANSKGKDSASGGGTPGQAPKTPRTIKEAGELAFQELDKLQ